MKRTIFVVFASIFMLAFFSCSAPDSDKTVVGVSIVPEKAFVEAVAGDDFSVAIAIPPGSSPATYEPTPKEKAAFSKAAVFFAIGVPTEKTNVVKSISENTKVVHLEKLVSDMYEDRHFEVEHHHDADEHDTDEPVCPVCGHVHHGRDPHIWLSPKRVIVMVEAIKDELSALKPENAEKYATNAAKFIDELQKTDEELKDLLANIESKDFFVFHPAFGYFADDYGLKMHSLENEGKEATADHMMEMVKLAKDINAKAIFYQKEIDSSQSKSFAEEIGGKTIQLSPLAENYIENLYTIAKLLVEVNEK